MRVQGLGLRVEGSGLRVEGSGFRVQGSGFRVQGAGVASKSESERESVEPSRCTPPPLHVYHTDLISSKSLLNFSDLISLKVF